MSGMDRNITVYLVNPAASETISQVSDDHCTNIHTTVTNNDTDIGILPYHTIAGYFCQIHHPFTLVKFLSHNFFFFYPGIFII